MPGKRPQVCVSVKRQGHESLFLLFIDIHVDHENKMMTVKNMTVCTSRALRCLVGIGTKKNQYANFDIRETQYAELIDSLTPESFYQQIHHLDSNYITPLLEQGYTFGPLLSRFTFKYMNQINHGSY